MLLKNLLYIFQAEQYAAGRFLRYAYSHPRWWDLQRRGRLRWTVKAAAAWLLSWGLLAAALAGAFLLYGFGGLVLAALFLLPLLPFVLVCAALILKPAELGRKRLIINRARRLVRERDPVVVGITGSYGKTTAKEITAAVLAQKFSVLKTPENVNTELGVAQFLLRSFRGERVLVVEMAAHYPGDIARLCRLTPPHYAVLTGINEAHLERFGSLENTVREKFTLPLRAKIFSVLNFDDRNVRRRYRFFPLKNFSGVSREKARRIKFLPRFQGMEFELEGEKFKTLLLAREHVSLILLAAVLARKMGLQTEQIKRGVAQVKPLPHRLQPIYNAAADIWVIDDSYNANPAGVRSGLEVLSRAPGRKIVLTPGMMELGKRSAEIHRALGRLYAAKADLVLLIDSGAAKFVREGMEEAGFGNYRIYPGAAEAHEDLKNILRPGDTIIFQGDLPDIYA